MARFRRATMEQFIKGCVKKECVDRGIAKVTVTLDQDMRRRAYLVNIRDHAVAISTSILQEHVEDQVDDTAVLKYLHFVIKGAFDSMADFHNGNVEKGHVVHRKYHTTPKTGVVNHVENIKKGVVNRFIRVEG